jgi:membrane peptidoglycan carboxypeptidase
VDIQNFDGIYHGPLRMRMALANDYRVPVESVRLQVGNENVEKITASFGLAADRPVHLLQLSGAYGAFATQGVFYGQEFGEIFGPSTILRVDAVDGQNWLDWSVPQARPVVTAGLAYLVTNILSDEAARWPSLGSPSVVEIGRPAGVKLGQTQDGLDAWAAGYTPDRVVVTWVGSRTTPRLSAHLPAVLWSALMQAASQGAPRDGWPVPQGVAVMDVCDPSGLLPTSDCPSIVSEIFLQGSEPTQADTLYRSYQVNRETGSLATVFTPPQFVEKKVFMIVPPEAQSWAQAAGIPTPPSSYDAIQPPPLKPDVNIRAPKLFADVSRVVQIVGTASGPDFDHYRLQAGKGFNPQEWIQIGQESSVPVEDGVLAEWDTSGLDGLYALQLVVVHSDQRVETAVIQVNIINP